MKTTSACVIVLALAGCSTAPQGNYLKAGVSETAAHRDRYECLQAAQQPSTQAYVNAYGGGRQDAIVTNPALYDACARSRGYQWVPNKHGK